MSSKLLFVIVMIALSSNQAVAQSICKDLFVNGNGRLGFESTVNAALRERTSVEGTFSEAYRKLKEIAGFDEVSPSKEVLKHLLVPISEAALPLPQEIILNSINFAGPFVAKGWQLTTLHRPPLSNSMGGQNAFLPEPRFSNTPFSIPGMGIFLFALGHPKLMELKSQGIPFQMAINQIPLSERPDLGLVNNTESSSRSGHLAVAKMLAEQEIVYVIHSPVLKWLPVLEREELTKRAPFVSIARVQKIDGRVAMIDVFASEGSSGGTVLNSKGEVAGVLSASSRPRGKSPVAFMMILDDQMRAIIEQAGSVSPQ